MKLISILMVAVVAACAETPTTPDAELVHSVHDQTAFCDRRWADAGGPLGTVTVCEFACAVMPQQLDEAPRRCDDNSRPCARPISCERATSPIFRPVTCESTFYVGEIGDGIRGCCLPRPSPIDSRDVIPTFWQCPPDAPR